MIARQLFRGVILSMGLLVGSLHTAYAHEIRPAIADVEIRGDRVTLTIRMALEGLVAGIDLAAVEDTNDAPEAAIFDSLRALEAPELEEALRTAWPRIAQGFLIFSDGARVAPEIADVAIPAAGNVELPRDSILTLEATLPPGDEPVVIGWDASYGILVLRQIGDGEGAYEGFLTAGALSDPLPRGAAAAEGMGAVLLRYIGVGFEQIIPLGLDHILFVLGLFFFAPHLTSLVWQGAAFALAHSITLALAATGVLTIPAAIIAPLVAASIVYIGVENAFGWGALRARIALVFAFGLVHGVAFAGALAEYGVVSGQFVAALAGFNIGIEIGQLVVIGAAFLAVGLWFGQKPYYRRYIAAPASLIIAGIGAFWLVERTLL